MVNMPHKGAPFGVGVGCFVLRKPDEATRKDRILIKKEESCKRIGDPALLDSFFALSSP